MTETIPTTWDDDRDGAFFRITARLFRPAFCAGAGLLLAGHDDSEVPVPRRTAGPRSDLPSSSQVPSTGRRRDAV